MTRSWGPLVLAIALALVGCDDGPPPAVPANPPGDVPPPPPPPPPPPGTDGTASGDDSNAGGNGAMYASGEYAIGENYDAYDDNDPSALTDFHQALDSHGAWADDPTYGTVWVPDAATVGADFVPYSSAGHWVIGDDDQYVWVSDYDWGWAPFHYGRWVYIDGRGWAWIPGRAYRGAWVDWGWDDGYAYVGWYPMAPAFFWFGGVAVAPAFYVGPRWVYCPRGEVFSASVGTRILAGPTVAAVSAKVHVAATPGRGPAPGRLGYAPSQVPHASGAASVQLAHAQQFSRPSTATAMGGSPRAVAGPSAAGRTFNSATPFNNATPGANGAQPQSGRKRPPEETSPQAPKRTSSPPPRRAMPSGGGTGGGSHGGGGHHR